METNTGRVVKVKLSAGFWILLFCISLITFGAFALVFILAALTWPKVLDDEGLTLRTGKRYLWANIYNVRAVTVRHTSGIKLTGRVELEFYINKKFKKVRIVPFSTGNMDEVLDFLSVRLGSHIHI